jgi:hypothetical protein
MSTCLRLAIKIVLFASVNAAALGALLRRGSARLQVMHRVEFRGAFSADESSGPESFKKVGYRCLSLMRASSVVNCQSAGVMGIAVSLPCGDLVDEDLLGGDAPVETL